MNPDRRVDVAIIGGGIAGATLALVLARAGLDVMVLEKQRGHRDRVLGEALAPWGVAEAQAMDVFDVVRPHGVILDRVYAFDATRAACDVMAYPEVIADQVPGVPGVFGVGNPTFAASMLTAAEDHGATVRWSSLVRAVDPPHLAVEIDGTTHTISAGMIVGADGKGSETRRRVGLELSTSGPHAICAGMLASGLPVEVPSTAVSTGVDDRSLCVVFPQGDGRARLYQMFGSRGPNPYLGAGRGRRFLDDFAASPMTWGPGVARGEEAGPCSTFPIHDAWIDVPHRPGVVLVGDAAGYSNPLCAQGLSICMRDVRLVTEILLGETDWHPGVFDSYARERRSTLARLRTFAQFFHLLNVPGPRASQLRERAREIVARDHDAAAAFATIHLGPVLSPPHALDPTWLEATFGVRLGAEPAVVS